MSQVTCWHSRLLLTPTQSNLEFMLRFQQYIELVRTQHQSKLLESIAHAKRYLLPFKDSYPKEVQQACGLLAFPPGTRAGVYSVCSPALFYICLRLTSCRTSTAKPAGPTCPTSSCKPITNSSPSPPPLSFM